jgi:hypothetical protein
MKKRLLQLAIGLFTEVGDQIMCFLLLAFILFGMVTGAITLFTNPPSVGAILIIMSFGVFFGLLRFFTSGHLTENINKEKD